MALIAASLAASAADCLGSCGVEVSSAGAEDASTAAARVGGAEVVGGVADDAKGAGSFVGDEGSTLRWVSVDFAPGAEAFCNGASAGFVGGDDVAVLRAASIKDDATGAATDHALGHMDGSW